MIKYIMNMDKIKELCVYDVDTGKYDFKYNGEKLIKPNLGFFTRVRDNVYGVTESKKGPVFFKDNKFYLDISIVENNREKAINIGKYCNQKAIYDIENKITIYLHE